MTPPLRAWKLRLWLVGALERACDRSHPIVHRRPFLWLPLPICPLFQLSEALDHRWGTSVWGSDDDRWTAEDDELLAGVSGSPEETA